MWGYYNYIRKTGAKSIPGAPGWGKGMSLSPGRYKVRDIPVHHRIPAMCTKNPGLTNSAQPRAVDTAYLHVCLSHIPLPGLGPGLPFPATAPLSAPQRLGLFTSQQHFATTLASPF